MSKLEKYDYKFYYKKYYDENKSTTKIAEELGVSKSSVVRRMRKMGFELRSAIKVKCSNCGTEVLRHKYKVFGKKQKTFYCSDKCESEHRKVINIGKNNPFFGKKHTSKTKELISKLHKGKEIPMEMRYRISKNLSGEKSPNWKNGSKERNKNDRLKLEYRLWRKSVFERDNYTCGICGQHGGKLNVHHKKNFADNIYLRTSISNGITLCEECHLKFHSIYGKRNTTEEQLIEYSKSRCKYESTGS